MFNIHEGDLCGVFCEIKYELDTLLICIYYNVFLGIAMASWLNVTNILLKLQPWRAGMLGDKSHPDYGAICVNVPPAHVILEF